ncbi:hypothetical protein [Chryseobacterium sp. MP_3.2]|uniref:hypothetical protein n=1 Tax=Chryseobacterium sp. MP_3.2 TaxID=3071712 RepID=UPI002DFDBA06|nr:hypothetical protein [Chryseobacterium sp. MP_3.2]
MKKLFILALSGSLIYSCEKSKPTYQLKTDINPATDPHGLTVKEKEILNQHQIPISNIEDEVKNAYLILKSDKYYIDTEILRFSGLSKKAKGNKQEFRIIKTRDSLIKNEAKIAEKKLRDFEIQSAKESSGARKKYGEDFRNKLLDNGLNIRVSVSGKENKKIKLTYVLFDEVWFRKFENEGYFDQIHDQGFTHIELTDGYDYGQYMKYEK